MPVSLLAVIRGAEEGGAPETHGPGEARAPVAFPLDRNPWIAFSVHGPVCPLLGLGLELGIQCSVRVCVSQTWPVRGLGTLQGTSAKLPSYRWEIMVPREGTGMPLRKLQEPQGTLVS